MQGDAEFDRYQQTYRDEIDQAVRFTGLKANFFARAKAEYLKDIAASHFDNTKQCSVLDFGCGIGLYAPLLRDAFGHMTGVDVSAACVTRARNDNPGLDFEVYDGKTLPFADESFDLTYAITVLHHVPPSDWLRTAREILRVLKSGGLLAIFEHNPCNPLTMRVVRNCIFDTDAVLLQGAETVQLMEHAGFRNVVLRYILTLPVRGRLLRHLDMGFARIPIGAQYYTLGCKL